MWVSLSLRLWWIVAIAPNPPYRLIRRTAVSQSRQQSATHSQDRKQSNKKNLTWKHPSVGQIIAPFVVDRRYRSESTLQIDPPYGRYPVLSG